ncbi:CBS domain-containing protein [Adhaeretor mobilis]|uniref:Inosine 5'-monophosphate dehydrogenase n=1 Tax=Adhaeretor mobilis TaxID=1930276 RepID=A0A517MV37_9BACT|nr:CBS domain-containing protein [Adhaeretor mobilis]QDS98736.1 inosine 5'-monophosphate dehydrogenase [Adhaeretor mobilis]
MGQLTARDFMVKKLVTLKPEMDVLKAVQLLLKNRISGAPVVGPEGNFMGVFSEKCCMHFLLDAAYDGLPSASVEAFMDCEAQTIEPNAQLLTIAQVFLLTPYRRLPVLDQGKLIGQISRRDVLHAAMKLVKTAPPRASDSTILYLSALRERNEAPVS